MLPIDAWRLWAFLLATPGDGFHSVHRIVNQAAVLAPSNTQLKVLIKSDNAMTGFTMGRQDEEKQHNASADMLFAGGL